MKSRSCNHESKIYPLSPAQLKAINKIKETYKVGEEFIADNLKGINHNTFYIINRHGFVEYVRSDSLMRKIYKRIK